MSAAARPERRFDRERLAATGDATVAYEKS
jgi:hypothetical protein